MKKNRIALIVFLLFSIVKAFSQSPVSLDFKDKELRDIILGISNVCEKSVIVENNIKGKFSFHFENMSFDSALNFICQQNDLFYTYDEDTKIYNVSKLSIKTQNDLVQIYCEDTDLEYIIKNLSKKTNKTILYDPLPKGTLSLRTGFIPLADVLELIITKYYEYSLIENPNGFYVARTYAAQSDSKGLSQIRLSQKDNLYNLSFKKSNLGLIIEKIFTNAKKEYSLFFKPTATIENINFTGKEFDELLSLILDQANADFYVENDIYYIFEIQKKDVLKNLKQTQVLSVNNYSVQEVLNLIPQDLAPQAGIKADKTDNKLYITGSKTETAGLIKFIKELDEPKDDNYYKRFELKFIKAEKIQALLPQNILFSPVSVLPESNSFVTRVTHQTENKINEFLEIVDKPNDVYLVKLKYKKAEDFMKNLPPNIDKESITLTGDDSLLFFNGTKESYNLLKTTVDQIDHASPQIKYHLLVVQYSDSDNFNWSSGIDQFKNTAEAAYHDISGIASNLLNVNFDVVSTMGFQLTAKLNSDISEQKANVLADTTITSISGKEVSFKNTNTTRYRDKIYDATNKIYTSTTQEITSGLVININGWTSGDNMITVDVKAQISKEASASATSGLNDGTEPPSTTEKTIDTHVRTRSGKSIIIGGLLQKEKDTSESKPPVLGSIPLLGYFFKTLKNTERTTELVIYLIPFVENETNSTRSVKDNLNRYISEFL